jgi:hypothetical protein
MYGGLVLRVCDQRLLADAWGLCCVCVLDVEYRTQSRLFTRVSAQRKRGKKGVETQEQKVCGDEARRKKRGCFCNRPTERGFEGRTISKDRPAAIGA